MIVADTYDVEEADPAALPASHLRHHRDHLRPRPLPPHLPPGMQVLLLRSMSCLTVLPAFLRHLPSSYDFEVKLAEI